jgi:tRNA 2-thiouridine synthesizing protein A
MAPTADVTLDASGLACPIPILKTRQAMDKLQSGQVLKLIATDPGSVSDVAAWATRTGNALLKQMVERGTITFYIRKA